MSRLDELIAELCPDGVNYYSIEELIKRKIVVMVTPSFKIKRNDYKNIGTIPIISQELEYISGYCNRNDERIIKREYVCFGDHSEHIKYINFAFVQGADGLKIMYTDKNKLLTRYFYHSILNFYNRHNNYERHFKYLGDTNIPVPPIEVQKEIVRMLDNFTKLTAELTAELTARQKQYEFYRDTLLTFDVHGGGTSEVQWKTLGEIAKIKNGKTYKNICSGEIPVYGSGGIMTYIGEYCYNKPSVLVPRKGSLSNLFYVDTPFWNVDTIFYTEIDEQQVVPKYLFYLLKKEHIERLNTAGGVPSLTQTVLNNISLAIPSITVQKRIVDVLDNFEKICNDLNIGLPAEIEARQKQYEYYRDKLLTFKEK